MGDMEQYEIKALRRDGELDQYYDWLGNFPHWTEPRVTLLSWLQFEWYCPSCGRDVTVTKQGEHSYEGDCEHILDRQGVDAQWADMAQERAYEESQRRSELVDCPVHLIPVPVIDWYRDYGAQGYHATYIEVLACKCKIVAPPMRKPCPSCPTLDKRGTMPARLVTRQFTTARQYDATAAYELDCGHTTIDL